MHHLLIAILLVTFFLNVVFRFFLVLYAEGFLKKGSLNLTLFKQLYWLSWFALVTLGITPFAITPIILGNFPSQDSYRKHLCLGGLVFESSEKDANPFGTRILMVLMAFYILRFVHKVNSFVNSQCPGGKLSSIGKFERNVLGLRQTCFIALNIQCFCFLTKFLRELTKKLDNFEAFFVNFVVFDGFVYLLPFCVFLFARGQEIPTRKNAAKNVEFYVSKVQVLKPRRPEYFNVPSQCTMHCLIQRDLNIPNNRQELLTRRANLKTEEEKTTFVELNASKTDRLKPKTSEPIWTRASGSNNKIHPRVTLNGSSVQVEPTVATVQSKREDCSRKATSANLTSVGSAFAANPNPKPSFSSEVLLPSVENSEKRKPKAAQRFSYFRRERWWKLNTIPVHILCQPTMKNDMYNCTSSSSSLIS